MVTGGLAGSPGSPSSYNGTSTHHLIKDQRLHLGCGSQPPLLAFFSSPLPEQSPPLPWIVSISTKALQSMLNSFELDVDIFEFVDTKWKIKTFTFTGFDFIGETGATTII